jgi:hypothetical protein
MTQPVPVDWPTLSSLGFAWSPLTSEQGPFGQVLWLEVAPVASGLMSASTGGEVSFSETGVVARLHARNQSDEPVLLPGDLIVDGGRQARVIESSVVLAPDSTVDIPVRCVEKGRWHAKHGQPADAFEVHGSPSSITRMTFARSKTESLRVHGSYALDQSTVWTHVGDELERTHVRSSTHSYTDFLRGARAQAVASAGAMVQRAPWRANALVLTHVSGSAWMEVLPTHHALRVCASSLLADLFEPTTAPGAAAASATVIVERTWREPLVPVDVPARTLGHAFAFQAARTFGSALLLDGRLAHIGVGHVPSA